MSAHSRDDIGDALLHRIYSEFLEMPGLRLTPRQAQRLWGLDEQTCHQLLEFLVEEKFLCPPINGAYLRLTDGPFDNLRPRMAKARIDSTGSREACERKEAK